MSSFIDNLLIRQEHRKDWLEVERLIEAAFKEVTISDHKEHLLVRRLRNSKAFVPELSMIAEIDNKILGHILLTKITIDGDEKEVPSLALAPISVMPDYQGQGIGSMLINHAHHVAKKIKFESIILIGHAHYYPRFGYRKCSEYGIKLPFDTPDENCLALELVPGALIDVKGYVIYPKEFYE
jgi:predicted N-acetyltransferase YhbS